LARELEMCYLGIGLVTDWDVGIEGDSGVEPVTAEEVVRVFQKNNEKVKSLIYHLIPRIADRGLKCTCGEILAQAKI